MLFHLLLHATASMKDTLPTDDIKSDSQYMEKVEHGQVTTSNLATVSLPQPHQDYLLQRHGTLDLDPIPSLSAADPYNWPTWKVCARDCILVEKETDRASCLETDEPDPRRLPCLYLHNHGCQHHPSVRRHCKRTWCVAAACELSHLASDRCVGRCTFLVETLVQSVRTSAHLSLVRDTELGLQCGLCEESNIRLDGCV